jgi:hypothetical protein
MAIRVLEYLREELESLVLQWNFELEIRPMDNKYVFKLMHKLQKTFIEL